MTLGASFSKAFASLTTASHFELIGEESPEKIGSREKATDQVPFQFESTRAVAFHAIPFAANRPFSNTC
jgi:hypothetical protein